MDALDKLGLAIVNAGYTWTNEMREAYEQGRKEISQLTAMTKEPTKLMAIPALMEAAGWVRKKELVGLTDEDMEELSSAWWKPNEDEMALIDWVEAKLKEKNNG